MLLLLRHHFQLLKKAQAKVLDKIELIDARNSLRVLHSAAQKRASDLMSRRFARILPNLS